MHLCRVFPVLLLFLVLAGSPAWASATADFQKMVTRYTSGELGPQEFLSLCTALLRDAPLSDRDFAGVVRRYRAAVLIQMDHLFEAEADARLLAEDPATRLIGIRLLAGICEKRHNYGKAIALLQGILDEMDKGHEAEDLDAPRIRGDKARLENVLNEVAPFSATDLAGRVAGDPDKTLRELDGKILRVTGRVLSAPQPGQGKRAVLIFDAAPPLTAFLDQAELPYLGGLGSGDEATLLAPLKTLDGKPVLSPARYLDPGHGL